MSGPNLTKPDIAAVIEKAQAEIAKKADVSLESLLAELEEARTLAIAEKQPSAAVSTTIKAKLTGRRLDQTEWR